MLSKRALIPTVLIILAVVFVGVGISTILDQGNSVEGQVIGLEQTSLTTFSTLQIQDASGKEWLFHSSGEFTGFTPSHLVEHSVQNLPVTVEYEESDSGELMILRLSD